LRNTPKVVGGLTPECARRAVSFYEHVCDEVVEVSSTEAAELTKLLENIFRSVNIAYPLRGFADHLEIAHHRILDYR